MTTVKLEMFHNIPLAINVKGICISKSNIMVVAKMHDKRRKRH
jgi:hypothetical protein